MRDLFLTIVSDDLTGAVDSSAFSLLAGAKVRVEMEPGEDISPHGSGELISVNMSSRTLDARDSEEKHLRAAESISSFPDQIVMKKMDTGFRGNAAFEIRGLATGLGSSVCFIIDHSPSRGTFTLYGKQYVDGQILSKSVFAREDPLKRPESDSIPEILSKQGGYPVGLVDIDAVKGGDIAGAVAARLAEGSRVIVFDAVTDADTSRIIDTLQPLYPDALWAGSSGLARGLAAYVYGRTKDAFYTPKPLRCICVCGSAYSAARRQIEEAKVRGLSEIPLDIGRLAGGDAGAMEDALNAAYEKLNQGSVVITPLVEAGLEEEGLPAFIQEALADCAKRLCAGADFDRVAVIGGETSYSVFSALGAERLMVREMPEVGVGIGEICGGPFSGKGFAVKGGSIASDRALCSMIGLEVGSDV